MNNKKGKFPDISIESSHLFVGTQKSSALPGNYALLCE